MDLLNLMKDKPADFDICNSKQMIFIGDKSSIETVFLVLYDDSDYFKEFTGDDIKPLVKKREMEGVIIPVSAVKEMTTLLMDSYAILTHPMGTGEERLKVAQKINDALEKVRLF